MMAISSRSLQRSTVCTPPSRTCADRRTRVFLVSLSLLVGVISGCGAAPSNKVKISFPNLLAGLENQNSGSAELTGAVMGSPLTSSYRSPVATVGGSFESSTSVSPSYRVVGGVHIE